MDEQIITDALEQLASQLQPESMVKQDDQPLWYVGLPDDSHVVLRYLEDQRKLVCSSSISSTLAVDETNTDLHEWLLLETQDGAETGGVCCGLDEDGIVLFHSLPMAALSLATLSESILAVSSATRFWNGTLSDAANDRPHPPQDDFGQMMRI